MSALSTSHAPSAVSVAVVGVYPDLSGVGGVAQLESVIGALMTIVLVVAVLMIVLCAAGWAVFSSSGNGGAAGKARTGLLVALGAAVLDGAAVAWLDFLLHVGLTL